MPWKIEGFSGRIGFNHDGKGHGFVIADRAIDLRSHVDAILAAANLTSSVLDVADSTHAAADRDR